MTNDKKTNSTKIIFTLVLLALAALLIFFFIFSNQKTEKQTLSLDNEPQKRHDKKAALDQRPTDGKEHTPALEAPTISPEIGHIDTDQTTYRQAATKAVLIDPCAINMNKIDTFFTHLNNREYFTEFQLDSDSKTYFQEISTILLEKPPQITRETDNLLTILQNTAHFYRVLGKKNIFILKKIMAHEKEMLEPVMGDFYALMLQRNECLQQEYPIQLPLEKVYNYSVFFLNTLGGQAYLFRRDSSIRMLTHYYCILVLDQANEKGINHLGVDIRFHMDKLIEELTSFSGLNQRDAYLNTLLLMQEKYERKYGN